MRELARLASGERSGWPLERLPERDREIRAQLAAHAPLAAVYHGPAFRFAALPAPPSGTALLAPDAPLPVDDHFGWLPAELAECQPCAGALEDGVVRAICFAARRGPNAVEAGVETAPGFRRRGLATRAVAAWANTVAQAGLTPLYSTEWRNRASLGVAARLGLIRYAVDLHFR